jgi:endonuclease/exonuclease/phosphatase (EEP) superfamily protein YafD
MRRRRIASSRGAARAQPGVSGPRRGPVAARRSLSAGKLGAAARLLAAAALPLLAACITLTADPRALTWQPTGIIPAQTLRCPAALQLARSARPAAAVGAADALDPDAMRLVTWNIHKQGDAGWQDDLGRFAAAADVLLLQETTLEDSLQQILRRADLRWVMASSFIYGSLDIGVLTATRVVPVAACTQRVVEPLLRIPKSSVITWLPIAGATQTLAVANVHAINFTLSLDAYRAQFDDLADVLAGHDGPLVLAGDFNTWSRDRAEVVRAVALRLGLVETTFAQDDRTLFLGNQVDHVYVRGMDVVAAKAIAVTSSDHNPVEVVLRLARPGAQDEGGGPAAMVVATPGR